MSSDAEDESGSALRWMLPTLGALAALAAVVWWPGCRTYPAVTSRESLGMMRLLYTACNTKDPARLAAVEARSDRAAREGKLSPPEQQAFARIIGLAKGGDWPAAEAAALKFAQDQVGVGHPDPAGHDHDAKRPSKAAKKGK